jgi:hypothetical protein
VAVEGQRAHRNPLPYKEASLITIPCPLSGHQIKTRVIDLVTPDGFTAELRMETSEVRQAVKSATPQSMDLPDQPIIWNRGESGTVLEVVKC